MSVDPIDNLENMKKQFQDLQDQHDELKILYENTIEHNTSLEEQLLQTNDELAEKNKHITDSIEYAETIQKAILPSKTVLKDVLKDFFVVYMPKDIVSGDFFWYSKFEDSVFLSAVDCTGHGVPGALMSMLGSSLLNQIVNEKKIHDPARILENLNNYIRFSLKQYKDNSISQDGMDMCLIKIDGKKVVFAGAKRPLYIAREGQEVETIKGDLDSIGGKQKKEFKTFTNYHFDFTQEKRVFLYLTTEGFVDQPDPDRKKIGSKALIQWIQTNYTLSGIEQRESLMGFLNKHKQGEKQRDDITVLGVCIG